MTLNNHVVNIDPSSDYSSECKPILRIIAEPGICVPMKTGGYATEYFSGTFRDGTRPDFYSLTNKINRSIKEAVSKGEYETSLLLPTNCYDHDDVVECFNQFKNLGYDIFIGNDDRFGRDFCRISISWG